MLTKDQYGNIYNPDGRRDEAYQWSGFYFNLPINDTTVIVSILLNDKAEESSEMVLVGYTYNMNIWNDTKDKEEEKQVKKIFEKEVLDKLGVKYSKRWF